MAMWVIAMDEFSKVYKEVEPKIKKASEAEAVLKEVESFPCSVKSRPLLRSVLGHGLTETKTITTGGC